MLLLGGPHICLWSHSRFYVCSDVFFLSTRSLTTYNVVNRYHYALLQQPWLPAIGEPYDTLIPVVLFVVGQTLVLTSTMALGITGTFLGDYFGILMDRKVESFPFNILRDPMYVGSTMCFAAGAFWCVFIFSYDQFLVNS
jgi:hypothetical protein